MRFVLIVPETWIDALIRFSHSGLTWRDLANRTRTIIAKAISTA